jgi:4-diphosphocytidyl-2-C-methyl-D-erythritol kinase
MNDPEIIEFAPAKINLSLRVGQRDEAGYHPIDSLVVFADWGDEVRVRDAPGLMLTAAGDASRDLCEQDQNLVLKTARVVQKHAGIQDGAEIHLQKTIPVAAGMGGGSADAAATLRALNRLWGLGMSQDELAQLAIMIGADVPACIYSRPLRMRGIGDWIELLDPFPSFHAVIVNPGVPVSTRDVFDAFDRRSPVASIETPPCSDDVMAWLIDEPNDLQVPAVVLAPQITLSLDALNAQNGSRLVRMSGSGASCFGLYKSAELASLAAEKIRSDHPDWVVQATTLGKAVDA